MGAIGRNLESAADYVGSSIEDAFSGSESTDTGTDGSLSNLTAQMDEKGNIKYFDSEGTEIDPSSINDADKEAFMSADDEDFSAFGDVGAPEKSGFDFDPEKALKALGKMGTPTKQGALFSQAAPKGQLPLSMQGRVGFGSGYRATENPYQVPSYLMSSAQYNQQISQLLGGLLSRSIRNNPIKYLV